MDLFSSRIVILLLLMLEVGAANGQGDCVLRKDQDSIKVYTCHAHDSKFKSIKATFPIQTGLSRLVAFVMDVSNYVNWQYNTIEARRIRQVSENEFISYTQIKAPWPVSNRDMVTKFTITQDVQTRVVTITGKFEEGVIPARNGLVRVPMLKARWTITPVSTSQLLVEYTILVDPGGAVPAWMINMVAAEAPFDSFHNLRKQIGNWNEKGKEVRFIKD